ncbi:MAG: putative aminopeptidase YsdC [Firmicutes bacterium ADurb.Bin193]|nr:MAG: putative aminopeptidase YsdC [Firmicutes bacterium ADurb.Bin193]
MELLKKLTQAFGPSGNEQTVRDIITEEIKGFCDETKVDTLGNLVVRKYGGGKKLMLSAHMDEIGIIATVIDDKNFVHFSEIGGVKINALHSSKVKFIDGTIGIIYEKSEKPTKFSDLYIDIPNICKGEGLYNISVGDTAVMASEFNLSGDFVSSKALDDRVGCYILLETLKSITKPNYDLYFVFTVQEELGLRGAKTAAAGISPDYAIAVDVTVCDDIPGGGKYPLVLGKGPAIKVKDGSVICHPEIKRLLADTAKAERIDIQYEILDKGGTDAGAIHTTGVGVATGALSIPTRYIHTACETASISDIKNAVKLLSKVCGDTL